jgi:hypothetical protein
MDKDTETERPSPKKTLMVGEDARRQKTYDALAKYKTEREESLEEEVMKQR